MGFPDSTPFSLWLFVAIARFQPWPIEIDDTHDDCLLKLVILQFATSNNQRVALLRISTKHPNMMKSFRKYNIDVDSGKNMVIKWVFNGYINKNWCIMRYIVGIR